MRKKLVPRADRLTINREFTSAEEFIAEYVSNISASGVFIRTQAPLPMGTKVNLKFTVIMDELEVLEGVGQVVRVHPKPLGMGVVFLSLTSASKDLLGKLLTRPPIGSKRRMAPPPPPGSPAPATSSPSGRKAPP